MEYKGMEFESIRFNPKQIISECITTLDAKFSEGHLLLHQNLQPTLSQCYLGDPIRFKQIIINLLGNAIKFTKEGHIHIHAEIITYQQNNAILVKIKDTGIGIPKDKLDIIFHPFIQHDSTITRNFGGTGLGTTISKEIIELMGGKIWVESTVNVGSTFSFIMPAPHFHCHCHKGCVELKLDNISNTFSHKIQGLNLLLVEDIATNAELAQMKLTDAGHHVTIANNGLIAVKLFTEQHFDVILMDIQMPIMDGLTATKNIRLIEQKNNQETIPIIAMTASVFQEDINRCMKAGMNDFISKPIDFNKLFNALNENVALISPEDILQQIYSQPNTQISQTNKETHNKTSIIDTKKGLKIWGNQLSYYQSLHQFVIDHKEDSNKIKIYQKENNLQQINFIIHTLKGLSGNLCMNQLNIITHHLDDLLQSNKHHSINNQPFKTQFLLLETSLINLIHFIENNITITTTTTSSTTTKVWQYKTLKPLLNQLTNALIASEPEQAEINLEAIKNYLTTEDYHSLQTSIDNFEMDEANDFLQKIINKKQNQ
jgi:CheY-like chemotaxis protein